VVTVDLEKCTACGVCLKRFGHYCIIEKDGRPSIDYDLCNQCQKCIALCPRRAFLMNGVAPRKKGAAPQVDADSLEEFLARRRSTKRFRAAELPRRTLERITAAAAYAPNQNKNLRLAAVDDPGLIRLIDRAARRMTFFWHGLLCTSNPIAFLARLFMGGAAYRQMRKKIEYGIHHEKSVVYENTQALIAVHGNPRVPVTGPSAPFLLASMIFMAEALGVGTCLMDSIKLALNGRPALKRRLGLPRGHKVFGVLALGYSAEKIVNIPQGYSVPVIWNGAGEENEKTNKTRRGK
jgi:nitroreductase/NAD-dependent dihydropyrimidine dehydrogenase PreA subunit